MTEDSTTFTTELPIYGSKPTRPGMYLGLFHGRDEPKQTMEDWGFNGPLIGPLEWVHTTYTCTIRIAFQMASDALRYFGTDDTEQFLELHGDMLTFGGSTTEIGRCALWSPTNAGLLQTRSGEALAFGNTGRTASALLEYLLVGLPAAVGILH
jgi:hypothetical protein